MFHLGALLLLLSYSHLYCLFKNFDVKKYEYDNDKLLGTPSFRHG